MMAGAVPVKTQQLLDKSLIQKSSARGLICGKGIVILTLLFEAVLNTLTIMLQY